MHNAEETIWNLQQSYPNTSYSTRDFQAIPPLELLRTHSMPSKFLGGSAEVLPSLSPASAQPSHQLEWREAGSDFPSGEWSPELPSAGIAVSAHCHPLGQPQKSPNRFTYTGRSSSSPEYLQPMRDRVWGIRNPVSLPLRKKF